jgi:hypothetical protein
MISIENNNIPLVFPVDDGRCFVFTYQMNRYVDDDMFKIRRRIIIDKNSVSVGRIGDCLLYCCIIIRSYSPDIQIGRASCRERV